MKEWYDKIFLEAKKKYETEKLKKEPQQIHVLTDRINLMKLIKSNAKRCRARSYSYTQYLLYTGTELVTNLGIVGADLVIMNWQKDFKKAWRDTK